MNRTEHEWFVAEFSYAAWAERVAMLQEKHDEAERAYRTDITQDKRIEEFIATPNPHAPDDSCAAWCICGNPWPHAAVKGSPS